MIKKQEYSSIAYSAKKVKAKLAPAYSVLNPDTNSDSDSLKSKGARCPSARVQITHTGKNRRNKILDWVTERRLPIRLYLELDAHPDSRTENTITEPTQKNRTIE